jgi:hypothetical protein
MPLIFRCFITFCGKSTNGYKSKYGQVLAVQFCAIMRNLVKQKMAKVTRLVAILFPQTEISKSPHTA